VVEAEVEVVEHRLEHQERLTYKELAVLLFSLVPHQLYTLQILVVLAWQVVVQLLQVTQVI
jgi:hypothetical protein